MSKRLTTKEFIERSQIKYGDYYDYSKVIYINNRTKVTIVCPVHGDFTQLPSDHLRKRSVFGCKKCANIYMRATTEQFISKAIEVHGDKYDYSGSVYTSAKLPVTINCPSHGLFEQLANDHLNGCGCKQCRSDVTGWTDGKWELQGSTSKAFTGYRLYIIKCWDSEEVFYKIGKTFVGVSSRFAGNDLGYSFQVLKEVEGDARTICELERKYQRMNKENKYSPLIKFNGHTECFSKVVIGDVTYEN